MKEKIKKSWKLILGTIIAIIVVSLFFLFVLDIGINSKYFIRRDFNAAFLARKTGNCIVFKEYIDRDIENWGERCIKEKDGDNQPIKHFSIKEISVNGNSAFLQVELERDPSVEIKILEAKGEIKDFEKSYIVNYDMNKSNKDRFLFFIPKTRWLVNNEYRE